MQELIDFVTFKERKDRSRYIANRFESYLGGSVLDVGCYMKDLNKFIDAERYVGIDIAGDPDEVIDLDQVDKLPFADGEFDTVVCSDVLEHLQHTDGRDVSRIFQERINCSTRTSCSLCH